MKGAKKTSRVATGSHTFMVKLSDTFKSICDMAFIFTLPTEDAGMVQATEGNNISYHNGLRWR